MMEREQTKTIIRKINALYPNAFKGDDLKFIIDTWHDILKDYDFDFVYNNLIAYVKTGAEFPPKAGQLITGPKKETDVYVPDAEETRAYLEEQDRIMKEVANNPKVAEAREKALAEIRKILGIEGR
jgi:Loader and inhibitor of phage G40P